MLFTTTATIQGREIDRYLGLVFGDAVLGINVFKDLLGGLRDIVGGRSGTYERELGAARDTALQALLAQAQSLGAEAIVGIDFDYEVLGSNNGMLMVSASGTAVTLRPEAAAGAGGASSPWGSPPR
ncbi:heavy metal-binding domain-containing protein [Siccirubricoccus phaeus]|uniref:heavy metal-binding domain-containing protein n=1 Tax=Siccirubricoccus phaeus TaxID=2595053 RepID=UPI0011F0DE38|nr:heavy metal-binding domain-containing protein [Siccirubricoccus phaeus]